MAKSQRKISPPTPRELLGIRIQKEITSPGAQLAMQAVIYKQAHEDREHWEEITTAIEETDGVYVVRQDDGGLMLRWERAR
jgi:hypothetical protein